MSPGWIVLIILAALYVLMWAWLEYFEWNSQAGMTKFDKENAEYISQFEREIEYLWFIYQAKKYGWRYHNLGMSLHKMWREFHPWILLSKSTGEKKITFLI